MELNSCEALRDVTQGCRLILLAATDVEAQPLLQGFLESEAHIVATKSVIVGSFPPEAGPAAAHDAASPARALLAITGCDKANAAHALACLLPAMDPRPSLVLQSGVAGAYPRPVEELTPRVGDLVFATEEIYSDTGSSSPHGWLSASELGLPIALVEGVESGGRFPLDPALVRAAVDAVERIDDSDWPAGRPLVFTGPCVTTSQVTGIRSEGEAIVARWGALAESMEGAAAAQVCALHGVPFLEVRGVSNLVVDRDRASWQITQAAETAGRATLAVVASLDRLPLAAWSQGPESPIRSGA